MEGNLHIGGIDAVQLARTMGTPLMVYDEGEIRKRLSDYRSQFRHPELSTQVIYAGKAFLCRAMVQLVEASGCSLDVVSGGELFCALNAGFPAERIVFHGNNKTPEELSAAVEAGVGLVVLDNLSECQAFAALAEARKRPMRALLRINPGVEAHTHKYIVTAHPDSKFGVAAGRKEELHAVLETLKQSACVTFAGFHAHIGSQIFDKAAFVAEIEQLALLSQEVEANGDPVPVWDLGGGFAARYTEADAPIPVPEVCRTILDTCAAQKSARSLSLQTVCIEPGRSIVGEAGTTLYTVGWQKETASKRYLFVDGGMSDNIRPALYQANYRCEAAQQMGAPRTEVYTVAGRCCESGDILIENANLPPMRTGEVLAVFTTGAYCYSMASNYNHLGRPAVVFAREGTARCVLRRETPQDLLAYETDQEVTL